MSVRIDCQKTLKKVPTVNAKDMKPMMVEVNEIGASVECDTVIPIAISLVSLTDLLLAFHATIIPAN